MEIRPLVTIVMPCLNEARHVRPCLQSVLAQDYPANRLEVIVADGGSTDGTRAILQEIAAADPRVVVVDNPARIQAPGLNAAIREARGDVIVRMDVHCEYAPDYVRRCVEALAATGAWNAGGAQRARGETPFQLALCSALQSPLGVGGASYRSHGRSGFVDTVFLGAFPRRTFEVAGLYDPGAVTNEDAELNQRILDAGGGVYLSPDVVVHYYPRDSFTALVRQYYRYGRGRARTLLKHRRLPSIRPVIPMAMVVAGLALLATIRVQPFTPWLFGAFAALCGAEAVRVGWRGGLGRVLRVWAIFPSLYLAHGTGFAVGLVRYATTPHWPPTERLPPRQPGSAAGAANHGERGLDQDLSLDRKVRA